VGATGLNPGTTLRDLCIHDTPKTIDGSPVADGQMAGIGTASRRIPPDHLVVPFQPDGHFRIERLLLAEASRKRRRCGKSKHDCENDLHAPGSCTGSNHAEYTQIKGTEAIKAGRFPPPLQFGRRTPGATGGYLRMRTMRFPSPAPSDAAAPD